jgi:hypothetical protein
VIPDDLDPGIRRVVAWLTEHGFRTTDSGDGRTKFTNGAGPPDALPFPHVFMRTSPQMMVRDADRLRSLVEKEGLREGVLIEATYSPYDGCGILALIGVADAALTGVTR